MGAIPGNTTVQRYSTLGESSVWQTINHVLLMEVREAAGDAKERTFDALIARLRSLGRVNTLLVVLEDTHWADHQDREDGSLPRR